MARFITRIELKDATAKDYQQLNEEMKKESISGKGQYLIHKTKNRQPPFEYDCEGNISLSDITESAFRAARKTGKTYSFTVIRYKTFGEKKS